MVYWACQGKGGWDEEGWLLDLSVPRRLSFSCQRLVRAELETPGSTWYYLGGMVSFKHVDSFHCPECHLQVHGVFWQLASEVSVKEVALRH